MVVRIAWAALACLLMSPAALGAERTPRAEVQQAVEDYEARLEELSREVLEIRRDLEALVAEIVEQEAGRVFIFLENPPARWETTGVSVIVDGKIVFSRPFTPAELDVLNRGLPLELVELRLLAGQRRVVLTGLGEEPSEPELLSVERGGLTSWVARGSKTGIEWRTE